MKRLLVFALAVVFTLALAAQVTAEVTVGGHVRFNTAWFNQDDDASATGDSRTDMDWVETGISRVNFSYTGEDTTAFVEYSGGGDLRHIYATWAFAEGSELLVGHTDTLIAFGFTAQAMKGERALIGFGDLYGHRYPQIRYTRTLEDFGTLKVALITTMQTQIPAGMAGTAHAIIPRIEADLDFKVADVSISPSFSFNTFEVEGVTDEAVQGWTLGLNFDYALEAVKISGEAFYGANIFYVHDVGVIQTVDHTPTVVAGEVDEDTTGYGGFLQVSVPFEPMTLNVGAGMEVASNDDKGTEDEETATSYFVNVNYKATENLTITPEISFFDFGEDWAGLDNGTETYYGVNWVYVF